MSAHHTNGICRKCGACCAAFRVSFYWAEAARLGLRDTLLDQVTPHLLAMQGTSGPRPRCAALQGEVGSQVTCAVYTGRPSPCRELQPGDEKCARARARHGLEPLAARPGSAAAGSG
ncbi:MAG TPA: YkgJ family cysteine cluster protein [Steroidobacteraceae bacterium]|nr:YkgJ family cysteine cluster protein [Steroidobacteraceae bacterium]